MTAQELLLEQLGARIIGFEPIKYVPEVEREINKCRWLIDTIIDGNHLLSVEVPPEMWRKKQLSLFEEETR